MTREHLLDAMGLIDDALIRDAEAPPTPIVFSWRRLTAWAACLALVLALGYGATRLEMGGGTSGGASSGGSASGPSSGDAAGGLSGTGSASQDSEAPPSQGAGAAGTEGASVFTQDGEYRLTGRTLDALPQGSRSLGELSALYPDAPAPATDGEDYVGCPLFEGPEGTLYIQLPGGGFAEAEPVRS